MCVLLFLISNDVCLCLCLCVRARAPRVVSSLTSLQRYLSQSVDLERVEREVTQALAKVCTVHWLCTESDECTCACTCIFMELTLKPSDLVTACTHLSAACLHSVLLRHLYMTESRQIEQCRV